MCIYEYKLLVYSPKKLNICTYLIVEETYLIVEEILLDQAKLHMHVVTN